MTRDLTTAVKTEAESDQAEFYHLILLTFYNDGTSQDDPRRFTTSATDQTVDVGDGNGAQSWNAIKGAASFDPIPESGDFGQKQMTLTFPDVDQTLIAVALSRFYIGRRVKVWRVYYSGGSPVADPVLVFKGHMSGGWEFVSTRGRDNATETAKLTALNDVAMLDRQRSGQTNVDSYRLTHPEYATDTFFDVVPKNAEKREPWGAAALEK